MAKILKFSRRHESRAQRPATAAADISQMAGSVATAHADARRRIVFALFEMELNLIRCRGAIDRIPGAGAGKLRLQGDLRAIEQAMAVVQAVAAQL